jgi:hypothetical protein
MIGLLMLAGELIRGMQAPRLQTPVRLGRWAPSSKRTLSSGNKKFFQDDVRDGEAPALPRMGATARWNKGRNRKSLMKNREK